MITRIESGKRMSQAVVANGFVFLAGQVANDTTGSVENQTRQVLDEIDRLLALAGSGKEKILSANIYLANMADFAAMNSVWMCGFIPRRSPLARRLRRSSQLPSTKSKFRSSLWSDALERRPRGALVGLRQAM